jgi:hypothetical protein
MHHYDDKDFKDKHIWIKKTTGLGTYKSMMIRDDKFEIFEHCTYMIIRLNNGITLKISSVAMTNLLFLLISITNTSISASFADATSSIIPIEINPAVRGVAVSNMTFFLNHTDGHYHLNGLVKNISHLSVGYIDFKFSRQTEGVIENDSKSAFFVVDPIDPGVARPFDITTGFTPGQSNLFQHLKALVNIG